MTPSRHIATSWALEAQRHALHDANDATHMQRHARSATWARATIHRPHMTHHSPSAHSTNIQRTCRACITQLCNRHLHMHNRTAPHRHKSSTCPHSKHGSSSAAHRGTRHIPITQAVLTDTTAVEATGLVQMHPQQQPLTLSHYQQ